MGFPCGSGGKESTCNVGGLVSIPGLRRSPGEGKGYPLQYSGLENSLGSKRVGHDWATFTFTGKVFSFGQELELSHAGGLTQFLILAWSSCLIQMVATFSCCVLGREREVSGQEVWNWSRSIPASTKATWDFPVVNVTLGLRSTKWTHSISCTHQDGLK